MSLTIAAIEFDRIDYDRDADVLYLSSGDPQNAIDFDESPDGHALRYDGDGRLVGLTIVGARRLADAGRDVRVQAPVTLTADALASIVR
jgi:YD repeat-containing protein